MTASKSRRISLLLTFFVCVTCVTLLLSSHALAEGEAGDKAEASHTQQNFLVWVILTSGPIGLVIFILSIYFVATVSRLFVEFRPQVVMPPNIVQQSEELLQKSDFAGIYNLLKADQSFYSRTLTAGMSELPNGISAARESMEHVGEAVTVEMETKISMLAVLGTLGPMIGLLGTLQGMIRSFSVIARSDTQLKASEVAHGISEALLLTFEGVALSVPAIYFFAVFKNRVSKLSVETMLKADQFLRHFHVAYNARKKAQAPAASAPPPPKA